MKIKKEAGGQVVTIEKGTSMGILWWKDAQVLRKT